MVIIFVVILNFSVELQFICNPVKNIQDSSIFSMYELYLGPPGIFVYFFYINTIHCTKYEHIIIEKQVLCSLAWAVEEISTVFTCFFTWTVFDAVWILTRWTISLRPCAHRDNANFLLHNNCAQQLCNFRKYGQSHDHWAPSLPSLFKVS